MMFSKKFVTLVFGALLLVACGGGGGNGSPTGPVNPTPTPAAGQLGDGQLVGLVEWARSSYALPAMATVIVRNGQIVEMASAGLRSASGSESVTIDDKWHLGSLTKAMTSSLAGVLVEQSVLSWDTHPIDVWPELDPTIHDDFRNITLRQLLSHTAGIRRVDLVSSGYDDAAAGTTIEKRRALAAELLAETPVATIGQHSYSNGGYIIVGAMMESLMSAPWETLLNDYLFAPLGMLDSGFGAPGATTGTATEPWGHWQNGINYDPVAPGPDADNPQIFGPAGTVHATLTDYAQFMIAHIDGANGIGSFVTAPTFDTLHTPVINGSALGWGVTDSEDVPGQIELGHGGSNLRWYAVVRLVPGLDAGALYVVNAGGTLAAEAINELDNLITERFDNTQ